MAGSKRPRDAARQQAEQERARAAAQERRNRRLSIVGGVVVVLLLVGAIAFATGRGDDGVAPATDRTPTESAQPPTEVASPSTEVLAERSAAAAGVECTEPTSDEPAEQRFADGAYDEIELVADGRYSQRMTTNCGELEFTLDAENAPETSKAILFLTDRNQFYDNTVCHRLTTEGIFVLQCGDPAGNGTGGPGFAVPDENLPPVGDDGRAVYERGTVAMANAGPGTTGSQFFLVYEDSPLPPAYTVLGQVTEGIEILDHVAEQGVDGGGVDGTPVQPVQIQKMVSALTQEAN